MATFEEITETAIRLFCQEGGDVRTWHAMDQAERNEYLVRAKDQNSFKSKP